MWRSASTSDSEVQFWVGIFCVIQSNLVKAANIKLDEYTFSQCAVMCTNVQ